MNFFMSRCDKKPHHSKKPALPQFTLIKGGIAQSTPPLPPPALTPSPAARLIQPATASAPTRRGRKKVRGVKRSVDRGRDGRVGREVRGREMSCGGTGVRASALRTRHSDQPPRGRAVAIQHLRQQHLKGLKPTIQQKSRFRGRAPPPF